MIKNAVPGVDTGGPGAIGASIKGGIMRRSVQVFVSGSMFLFATTGVSALIASAGGNSDDMGSPLLHGLAMTTVFALATCVCALLLRAGWWTSAALTALGAALGPFVLLAPPWSLTLPANSLGEPTTPLAVRAGVCLVVVGWILVTALTAIGGRSAFVVRFESAAFGLPLAAVLLTLFGLPGALTDPGHEDMALTVALGWAMLCAGMVAAGVASWSTCARMRQVALVPVLAAVVVAGMYGAYNSTGGWPQVAGWSWANPPIYATVATAALLVVSGIVAALIPGVAAMRPRRDHDIPAEQVIQTSR